MHVRSDVVYWSHVRADRALLAWSSRGRLRRDLLLRTSSAPLSRLPKELLHARPIGCGLLVACPRRSSPSGLVVARTPSTRPVAEDLLRPPVSTPEGTPPCTSDRMWFTGRMSAQIEPFWPGRRADAFDETCC